jgi:hypothetical protein
MALMHNPDTSLEELDAYLDERRQSPGRYLLHNFMYDFYIFKRRRKYYGRWRFTWLILKKDGFTTRDEEETWKPQSVGG